MTDWPCPLKVPGVKLTQRWCCSPKGKEVAGRPTSALSPFPASGPYHSCHILVCPSGTSCSLKLQEASRQGQLVSLRSISRRVMTPQDWGSRRLGKEGAQHSHLLWNLESWNPGEATVHSSRRKGDPYPNRFVVQILRNPWADVTWDQRGIGER